MHMIRVTKKEVEHVYFCQCDFEMCLLLMKCQLLKEEKEPPT